MQDLPFRSIDPTAWEKFSKSYFGFYNKEPDPSWTKTEAMARYDQLIGDMWSDMQTACCCERRKREEQQ